MNRSTHSNEPFIKDFAFYKARFSLKSKDIKEKLRQFGAMVDRFESHSQNELVQISWYNGCIVT